MGLLSRVKYLLLGEPGLRPRRIRFGLLRGRQLMVDTANKSQRILGLDELEIVGVIRFFASRATTAIDIGANDGWYTIYFASLANIQQVIACDPYLPSLKALMQNLALNNASWESKLVCIEKFVGNRDDEGWCSVDRIAIDSPLPVLLKIDVDGGELEVLHGARHLLESRRALLVIETHSSQLEVDCSTYLRALGYETRIIRNGWYRLFVPEARQIVHNRWMAAWPVESSLT